MIENNICSNESYHMKLDPQNAMFLECILCAQKGRRVHVISWSANNIRNWIFQKKIKEYQNYINAETAKKT